MIKRILTLVLFLFFIAPVFSQDQQTIDSLTNVTRKHSGDTTGISALLKLSDAILFSDYDKSLGDAKNALALAGKLNQDYWTGRSEMQLGYNYLSYGYSKEAVGHYSNAIATFRKNEDWRYWLAKSLNGCGNAQRKLGRVKEATDSYLEAKKIFEALQDKKGIAGVYNNLGIIFMAEGQQEKALDYFRIARSKNIAINNQSWLAKNLSNMGNAFFNLRQYDSAEVYFKQSIDLSLALNDNDGFATDLMNLGNVYTSKKDYQKAKEQFDRAMDFDRKNGREAEMAFVMYNFGGLYTETGDYETAKKYLDSSVVMSAKYNDLESMIEEYQGLAVLYEKMGDFKNAFRYYNLYATKKDSITSTDMKNQMDQMEESLREEKLKEQNESLQQAKMLQDVQLNRSTIINYAAAGGIILVLLLAFTLLKRYQLKKKANDLLKMRNQEIQVQKTIIEQKNQDISDSINYAKKIQDTMLADLPSFHTAFPDAFIFFRPRNIVSGDFYWLAPAGEKTLVAVADCTGHGVPGAFMSMIGIDKINQAILESGISDPSGILSFVNRQLKAVLRQEEAGGMRDGMDVALVAIDRGKMLLEYSGANRPLWIVRNGELIELEPTKASIGGHTPATQEFFLHRFPLQKNDRIYLFSDGYADQFGGPKEKKMMTKNFKRILLSSADFTMEEQKKNIIGKFDAWKGHLEQVDDVCVVGICMS